MEYELTPRGEHERAEAYDRAKVLRIQSEQTGLLSDEFIEEKFNCTPTRNSSHYALVKSIAQAQLELDQSLMPDCGKCKVMLSAMDVHPKTIEAKPLNDEELREDVKTFLKGLHLNWIQHHSGQLGDAKKLIAYGVATDQILSLIQPLIDKAKKTGD